MSAETLEKARVAARAFGKDVSELNLGNLIEAIKVHRTNEQNSPAEASPTEQPETETEA